MNKRPAGPQALPLDVASVPLQGVQLVEASAGTGKTWTICGLVLRLVVERELAIEQVLVVTFTQAAAAELRGRIRARLVEAVAQWQRLADAANVPGAARDGGAAEPPDPAAAQALRRDPFFGPWQARLQAIGLAPDVVLRRLSAALAGFDRSAVFTIHGFCQRALAEAAFAAGAPFEQALEPDDAPLLQQVVKDFWRREVAGADGAALPPLLAAELLARRDSPEAWARLLRQVLKLPAAEQRWPAGTAEALDALRADSARGHGLSGQLQQAADDLRQQVQALGGDLAALLRPHLGQALNARSYPPDGEKLRVGQRQWADWLAQGDPLQPPGPEALLFTRARLVAATKKGQTPPQHALFDAAQRVAELQPALQAAVALARLGLLQRLLQAAPAALQALKRQRRVMAFDDLLGQLAQRLASAPALAALLRQQYPAALIDEFQDTDGLQWGLFRRIWANAEPEGPAAGADAVPALFLVGDPKQAIYAFRQADLHTYLAARASAAQVWTLTDNQRARGPLITALNALFGRHDSAFIQPGLQHHPVREGAKPRGRLHGPDAPAAALQLWQLPEPAGDTPRLKKAEAEAAALAATAAQVARWLASARAGRLLLDDRPLAAGDIALLVRSHRQGTRLRERLAALGVGAVSHGQSSLWASADADELARVLAAIAEPGREGLVRAALATAAIGCDAAGLLRLAEDEPAWTARLLALQRWRTLWQQRGVGSAIRQWMAEDGVAARLLARPDGERRLTNLRHLTERLDAAGATQPNPAALLRWLREQRRQRPTDDDSLLRLESDRHLVQIVTVHKSKGLEYPLVCAPVLWPALRLRAGDVAELITWHDPAAAGGAGGVVLDFRFAPGLQDKAARQKDPALKAIQRHRLREAVAEDLRLIYVALTRAVHHTTLVVGACGGGPKAARSALNWLLLGGDAWPGGGQAPRTADAWLAAEAETGDAAVEQAAAWPALVATVMAAASPASAGDRPLHLAPLPIGLAPPLAAAADGAEPVLQVQPAPAHIPAAWRIGSYSGLVHGAQHDGAAQDHDLRSGDALPAPADPPGPNAADEGRGAPVARTPAGPPADPPRAGPGRGRAGRRVDPAQLALDLEGPEGAPADAPDVLPDDAPAGALDGPPGGLPGVTPGGAWGDGPDHAPDDSLGDDDIAHFPRGPVAGDCLHAVFERADFADAATWPAAVREALQQHGPSLAPQPDPRWADQLQHGLAQVLRTPLPLPGGAAFTLAQLPARARVAELDFHLPVPSLGDAALNRWLRQRGYAMPPLVFGRLQGWLKGYIDLVFVHQGRWYLLDWKSNHLGTQADRYDQPALQAEMARQGYHLQHLLYSVALRRWLQRRVAGFDPARHFGGVLYAFVRGLRPGWIDASGWPTGLYHHRAEPAVLDELDALLRGQPSGAAGSGPAPAATDPRPDAA